MSASVSAGLTCDEHDGHRDDDELRADAEEVVNVPDERVNARQRHRQHTALNLQDIGLFRNGVPGQGTGETRRGKTNGKTIQGMSDGPLHAPKHPPRNDEQRVDVLQHHHCRGGSWCPFRKQATLCRRHIKESLELLTNVE